MGKQVVNFKCVNIEIQHVNGTRRGSSFIQNTNLFDNHYISILLLRNFWIIGLIQSQCLNYLMLIVRLDTCTSLLDNLTSSIG